MKNCDQQLETKVKFCPQEFRSFLIYNYKWRKRYHKKNVCKIDYYFLKIKTQKPRKKNPRNSPPKQNMSLSGQTQRDSQKKKERKDVTQQVFLPSAYDQGSGLTEVDHVTTHLHRVP